MSFGFRLKERREQLKLTQSDLAEMVKVTKSAIGNYENEVSAPKEEVLLKLFDALQIEPNYLFQDSYTIDNFSCTLLEQEHIVKYRVLDDYGKKAVDTTLQQNYERVTEFGKPQFNHRNQAYDFLTSTQIFAMGGFDPDTMEEHELIELANELYLIKNKK